jgi:hypothetical protein
LIPSKPENSNSNGFEHRPLIKGTKILLKVIKAINLNIMSKKLGKVAKVFGRDKDCE